VRQEQAQFVIEEVIKNSWNSDQEQQAKAKKPKNMGKERKKERKKTKKINKHTTNVQWWCANVCREGIVGGRTQASQSER
jgi:hypothetical protein